VYNIQKAVSRLDFAPKLKEIEVTDIKKGLGVFTPKPDKLVSFAALKETLKKAGYTLDAAEITVSGTLARDEKGWAILVQPSGQSFMLEGPNRDQVLAGSKTGTTIEISGVWKTVGTGSTAYESISPVARKIASANRFHQPVPPYIAKINFTEAQPTISGGTELYSTVGAAVPGAPIRVTSPGLTVYKGGAVTPRLYLIKQHLGSLEVSRQAIGEDACAPRTTLVGFWLLVQS